MHDAANYTHKWMGKEKDLKGFTREDLLCSLCGLNCGLCTMHLGGWCPGCGGGEGNQGCAIARCSLRHGGLEYCCRCEEYPCDRYEGIDEFDSFITHQNRRGDMEKLRRIGPEAYQAEQREKGEILHFLLQTCNDGRRKSLFALAVNLLELEALRNILTQLADEEGAPLRERAAFAAALLQEAATAQGVILKLRKKPGKSGT